MIATLTKFMIKNPAGATFMLLLVAIAVIATVIRTQEKIYDTLNFVPVTYDAVVDLLTPVFLVALFVERALEVFVSTGRKLGRAEKDRALDRAKEKIAQLNARLKMFRDQLDAPGTANLTPAERTAVQDRIQNINGILPEDQRKLRNAQAHLDDYKDETARIAFVIGTLFGLVIALAGLRVVTPLVDFELANWGWFQLFLFHSLDVLLTAGLLAGGASGIHQIIMVFGDFTAQTRKKAQMQ